MLIIPCDVNVFCFFLFVFSKEVKQSAAELGAGFSLTNNNYSAALVMSHAANNATLNQWFVARRFEQFPTFLSAPPRQRNYCFMAVTRRDPRAASISIFFNQRLTSTQQ